MLYSIKSGWNYISTGFLSFWQEYCRWRSYKPNRLEPRIYYGFDHIPSKEEKATGGIIKCQDLQANFPNSPIDANILYLVSSALPPLANYVIRTAKRKGLRLVWNQNGVAYPAWHGPGWEKTNNSLAYGLHRADYVIYQSFFCKLAADKFLGEFPGPSIVMYNPVDTSVFYPSLKLMRGLKVLVAGTHNQWYRIKIAVKAFKEVVERIPNSQLIIAGPLSWSKTEGEAEAELSRLIRDLSIAEKIVIKGPYSQVDSIALFHSAHILLHTQYNDACPRLVIEAMACGLPVVYNASGGTKELVGDEGGVGVESPLSWEKTQESDPSKLAEAVENVYNNYGFFSKKARERAINSFDLKDWLKKHDKIFQRLFPDHVFSNRKAKEQLGFGPKTDF